MTRLLVPSLLVSLAIVGCSKADQSASSGSTSSATTPGAAPPPAGSPPPQGQAPPRPTSALPDLIGRYPQIYSSDAFKPWLAVHRVARWHESAIDADKQRTVVVEGTDAASVFAAKVRQDGSVAQAETIVTRAPSSDRPSILKTATAFDLQQPGKELKAIRPEVTFGRGGPATVRWEAEFVTGTKLERYSVESSGNMKLLKDSTVKRPPTPPKNPNPVPEELADNELHHLEAFRPEAVLWTKGLKTVKEKAQRIYDSVAATYTYDGDFVNIDVFTWADLLVRNGNGRKGICDEYAVVSISYLRALGIPARMKFISWRIPGDSVDQAHAAVEYKDGNTWQHFDALWGFNDPGVYRQRAGATNVKVFDADFPLDSRSTAPAFGVPDPTGDGMLNPYGADAFPWGDFIYVPASAYPGVPRKGYSY